MPATLLPAAVTDIDAVLGLWRGSGAEPSHTDDAESLGKLIGHDRDALIVAVVGEAVVGTVIAGWDGWRGSIYRLVVAPDHRRRGIGGELLAAAEQRLSRCGTVRSQAIVVADDAQAEAFWNATDWHRQPQRLRYVRG